MKTKTETRYSSAEFEIEMNAKNRAYAFILSSGLLTRFAEFCRLNHSDDWHDTCVKISGLLTPSPN